MHRQMTGTLTGRVIWWPSTPAEGTREEVTPDYRPAGEEELVHD